MGIDGASRRYGNEDKSDLVISRMAPVLAPVDDEPEVIAARTWSAGPAGAVLTMQGPWVFGALLTNQWSFAGWSEQKVNAMLLQPFLNYNLPESHTHKSTLNISYHIDAIHRNQ